MSTRPSTPQAFRQDDCNDTMRAVHDFQKKVGMEPADGYAGVNLLARLRQAR